MNGINLIYVRLQNKFKELFEDFENNKENEQHLHDIRIIFFDFECFLKDNQLTYNYGIYEKFKNIINIFFEDIINYDKEKKQVKKNIDICNVIIFIYTFSHVKKYYKEIHDFWFFLSVCIFFLS